MLAARSETEGDKQYIANVNMMQLYIHTWYNYTRIPWQIFVWHFFVSHFFVSTNIRSAFLCIRISSSARFFVRKSSSLHIFVRKSSSSHIFVCKYSSPQILVYAYLRPQNFVYANLQLQKNQLQKIGVRYQTKCQPNHVKIPKRNQLKNMREIPTFYQIHSLSYVSKDW